MLAPQLILAAGIFVGCGAAGASPLIPTRSEAWLGLDSGIEAVRWRYRQRSFWSGRGDSTVGRGDTDGSNSATATRSLNGARSLPGALKFSGSIFHAGADGSTRRLRARAVGDEHGTSVRIGLSA
jgi:hypothetical protein